MRSTDSLLGVPATHHAGRAEAIFKEEEQQQQQQQRQQRQPRSTSRSKKIALLGGLRELIARSRSSGNKDTAAAGSATLGTKSPADLFAGEDAEHLTANTAVNGINNDDPATDNNIFENSPPRNVFSAASWPKATAAAGSPASGSNQCGGRPSHRRRREENFHAAMDNTLVYTAFSSFCNKTLSSENVEFVLQVREVNQLLEMEETTAGDLREKLRQVAAAFVNPNSATEVNVKGSTRASALCAIGAALDAAGHDGCCCCCGGGGRGNAGEEGCCLTSCAWALAEEAIEALARLAEEVHSVIFDGLWPRFLVSEEFHAMMNTEEMRMVGFTDLDGNVIVGSLASQQQQQQPSWEGGRGMRGSSSSMASKRHLSSRLVSSIKGLGSSGGGSGMGGWGGGEGAEMASASTASRGGGVRGGSENSPPPPTKTPFAATSRMLSSSSSSRSGGLSTGSCGDIVRATKTVENATTHAPPTTTTDRFPLGGRRNFGLPALRSSSATSSSSSSSSSSRDGGGGGTMGITSTVPWAGYRLGGSLRMARGRAM
ncbi:unnamed protein product [Ectocarpus sp. 12 AP-2014]